nr:glycosyltransferase family 39 protein [Burkholderiales bacterium]
MTLKSLRLPHLPSAVLLVALCAIWILLGLFRHEPWKPDEAYTFGLVYHIVKTGDWIVPTLAGEPFLEKPPIFFIVAALFAKAATPWLSLHDGARLATALFMALVFLFTGLTSRALYGPRHGYLSVVILLGCASLIVHGHKLITDTALLCGFAMSYYALAISSERPKTAGLLLGTGVGLGFMAKGLLAPGILGLTAGALLFCSGWRNKNYLVCLAVSLLAMAP